MTMGVLTRLVNRLTGLPHPIEADEDPVSRETHAAVVQHEKAIERKSRADLALIEMLGRLREKHEREPSKH